MHRQSRLNQWIFLAAAIAILLVPREKLWSAPQATYNLVVVMTDEHNFRTLGCYRELLQGRQAKMWGDAVVDTPHIDWLADNGALCTSYYATTPVCSPSRGAFISGMYPQHTPVVSNNIPLRDDVKTFAHLFLAAGYKTGYAGKWHLDGDGKPQWAPKRKFGFSDNRFMFNRGHWKKLEITDKGPQVGARQEGRPTYGLDGADENTFTTDFLIDRTVDFIRENQKSPFCYMVCIPDPHGPDTVRAPYDTMYGKQEYTQPQSALKKVDGLPSWGAKQQGNFNMSKYYGMVKCIDDNIGKLLDCLRETKTLDRTIIVFTADHGDLRGEHHRQNKGVPYEASSRVPFLFYFPGKIAAGTVVDEALGSVDFVPTLCSMLDMKPPAASRGRDASRLFTNAPSDEWHDIAFVRGTGTERGWLMAASDRYKLIFSSTDPPWLFDLERDPDEVINFFSHEGYRPTVAELARELRDYATAEQDPFINLPRIKYDVDWAINGSGRYSPPKLPAPKPPKRKAKKNKAK